MPFVQTDTNVEILMSSGIDHPMVLVMNSCLDPEINKLKIVYSRS